MTKRTRKSNAYRVDKVGVDKPIYFGIKKEAVTKYNQLHEAMEEAKAWPCKDNPYFYVDYDNNGFEHDSGGTRLLTEDQCEQLCSECPLLKLCYDFAVLNEEQHGIWGGIDFTQHREITRRKNDNKR
jgi:hypothetical protein